MEAIISGAPYVTTPYGGYLWFANLADMVDMVRMEENVLRDVGASANFLISTLILILRNFR